MLSEHQWSVIGLREYDDLLVYLLYKELNTCAGFMIERKTPVRLAKFRIPSNTYCDAAALVTPLIDLNSSRILSYQFSDIPKMTSDRHALNGTVFQPTRTQGPKRLRIWLTSVRFTTNRFYSSLHEDYRTQPGQMRRAFFASFDEDTFVSLACDLLEISTWISPVNWLLLWQPQSIITHFSGLTGEFTCRIS